MAVSSDICNVQVAAFWLEKLAEQRELAATDAPPALEGAAPEPEPEPEGPPRDFVTTTAPLVPEDMTLREMRAKLLQQARRPPCVRRPATSHRDCTRTALVWMDLAHAGAEHAWAQVGAAHAARGGAQVRAEPVPPVGPEQAGVVELTRCEMLELITVVSAGGSSSIR